ncbi:putative AAA family ATPase [Aspergillus steynii IBT 23096]|uniref:Putative AAA family ATPase n=1 Tax=Aspergillus steynii IBT 23096 TaxID=1392250 RepID=A0A2I2G6Z6_9EURO|nr:putative AAA family ATPase [Aspergillus steynii IBT 23096]PLB48657.1 putative AAA family ATPase [Aspergillus steynii IBT 23096]
MSQYRKTRLARFFSLVISGQRNVTDEESSKLFLEAVQQENNHVYCVERIIGSPSARSAVHASIRFNISPAFVNQYTSSFIIYLADPTVKQLCNGRILQKLLTLIVEPRTLWDALLQGFLSGELDQSSVLAFAWILEELLCLPSASTSHLNIVDDAQKVVDDGSLLQSPSGQIRNHGYKIKHYLQMRSSDPLAIINSNFCPGGRHDNDFADFREIAIYPTSAEFLSEAKPFYRRAEEIMEVASENRLVAHLDNQFRLLREDMLYEIKDEFQVARGKKKSRRIAPLLCDLTLKHIQYGDANRLRPCTLAMTCKSGLGALISRKPADRKKFLKDNRNYLPHQAFGCLMRGVEIVAFCILDRDIDLLCQSPPLISLRVIGPDALSKTLMYLHLYSDLSFLLVDAPVFAYEPILRCIQEKGDSISASEIVPSSITASIRILKTPNPVNLDSAQLESLLSGMTQSVSLIQGPPGTGKSFVGALLAKAFHSYSEEKILVMCYTNHALDQFLEDLLDIGIRPSDMVRLGSKSTNRTWPLKISEQSSTYRRSASSWSVINNLNEEASEAKTTIRSSFEGYQNAKPTIGDILEYLEFEQPDFFRAFCPPRTERGMVTVGRDGKRITHKTLYQRWLSGRSHELKSAELLDDESVAVWRMDPSTRQNHVNEWIQTLLEEQVANLRNEMVRLDDYQSQLEDLWDEKTRSILQSKRIIGCITTAAAMNTAAIKLASPGIVLLEEAGEILESHILTALGPETKQLILIGDHQQLRPKINNYGLSVEMGMISSFIKTLSYPRLLDDPKTKNRPVPRGLRDRVIFINHTNPEQQLQNIDDRDTVTRGSKQNKFEAEMVLKIVRYLGQQGYGTKKLVVLTPYLGQLHLLRDILRRETDPVLNDLDAHNLVRAGLLSQASAQNQKRPIKLSTIDNYQGEESDIVVATLTRSNENGDIGFMAAQQRLNVLLSRARNILIMIGNIETFAGSRKGKEVWRPFINLLHAGNHLHDGLPVKCEQHPDHKAIICTPEDFDTQCPDGGCHLPCGVKLNCGVHDCPYRCHQLSDHSQMECRTIVQWECPRKHRMARACSQVKADCHRCAAEDKAREKREKRDADLEAKRDRLQKGYMAKLDAIKDEIEHERQKRKDQSDRDERERVLEQQRQELHRLKNGSNRADAHDPQGNSQVSSQQPVSASSHDTEDPVGTDNSSPAEEDWKHQKDFEGAQSDEIDSLMAMIGLEGVKQMFLDIKAQVDTAIRQGIDCKSERYGSVLLGNPGTGKTTVAGLYAKFLTAMGVLPGSFISETTGSRLANDGVKGCQKLVDDILTNGGGVLFIDEAYQLAQGNSPGSQVIDFILGESEKLTGKVVILLAGYRKPMEKFFAHNPGLPSRFPREFAFDDYTDSELNRILAYQIEKKFSGRMKVEGSLTGLYCRIVARRLGRQRGKEGFANARAVENACSRIFERQARRLKKDRRHKKVVDDLYLTKEDLIGPEPSAALEKCAAWKKLKSMIGLSTVKKNVKALLDSIQFNYHRELNEEPLLEFTLNRVFLGSPGTGKTTVAKLYGQILVDIGFLSTGEVVVKNPADFVGSVLGESEKNTKGILASTLGKVLVIDEAYGLYGGTGSQGGAQSDIYKTAVVDTIVAEVQSTPGDDRCVLLLGYEDQMRTMFQNVNPGLTRRFPLDSAFTFEDFTDHEMGQIMDLKLKQQGFKSSPQGRKAALEVLARARNRSNFGNAGEIDILLNAAKLSYQRRLSEKKASGDSSRLEPEDFDPDFGRADREGTNIPMLFSGVVGCEKIVQQLEGYCQTVKNMRELDMDPREQIPFNFLFKGPPGTGKTSTARRMGKVYYDMGLLSSAEVIESSTTDLIGQYIGQTGPKTQAQLEKALGKVLLIDEAYRLAEGQFATEAMDEIVDCITKPKFFQKLIIILAGYDKDINRLMAINPGLTSRFPESVEFNGLGPDDCTQLLTTLLKVQKKGLSERRASLDMGVLELMSQDFKNGLYTRFATLSNIENWANARDVQTLAKGIFGKVIRKKRGKTLVIDEGLIIAELDHMINERTCRQNAQSTGRSDSRSQGQIAHLDHQPPPPSLIEIDKNTGSNVDTDQQPEDEVHELSKVEATTTRDAGVSDAVWGQLQRDKLENETREKSYQELAAEEKETERRVQELEKNEKSSKERPPDEDDNEKKRREQERILHEILRRKREAAELEQQKEQKAQHKLRKMGVCCMGYAWIRQSNGYRCAGGSHFVSNQQLGIGSD